MQKVKINIGFDAKRIVSNSSGLGSYGRTLINALSKNNMNDKYSFLLFAPDSGKENLRNQIIKDKNIEFVYSDYKIKILRDYWRENLIVKDLLRKNIKIYHGLSNQLPANIKQSGIKSIVTIHDLIFLTHPEFYPLIDRKIYKRKFYQTIKEADVIIAISECTKRDIIKFGNATEQKIKVVYQSCANTFKENISSEIKESVRKKYSLPERFILNVGTIEKRKNVLLAVKSLNFLSDDLHIVIVGKKTKYANDIEKYAKENNITHRVHMLSGVSNEDLAAIYNLAQIFVYPSIYEGFGIPIIEAMQNKLPVIACKGSCLEEAGGENSLYVEPNDVEGMTKAIKTFLDNEETRIKSINEGLNYIKRFENNNIASNYFSIYENLLNN